MPRILVLCEYSSLNGGEQSLLSVLPHLASHGFQITVACPQNGDLSAELIRINIPTEAFNVLDENGQRRPIEAIRKSVSELVKRLSPHCVHANSLSMTRLLGSVAESIPVPCVGHLRDMIRISRAAVAHLNALRRLLAVSHAVNQWYVAQGVIETDIQVLHNGVDLHKFAPRPRTGRLLRELNLPRSALLVGAVGQIGMRKGLDVLFEALAPIVQQYQHVHLLVVGQRYSQKDEAIRFEQTLLRAATQPPLRSHVHFLGIRDDIPLVLNELDILVHAARQEPLGRVLLEAAATGRPIVATRVGGTREIFPPESGTALLVPADSATSMTLAIQQLIADPAGRHQLGQLARKRALQCFCAKRAAHGLAEQYRNVLV